VRSVRVRPPAVVNEDGHENNISKSFSTNRQRCSSR
jgi:hypothetical protein